MKIAVLGAGQLGSWVYKYLTEEGFDVELLTREDGDFSKFEFIDSIVKTYDAVINCIAYTDVDNAEKEALKALNANLTIPTSITSQMLLQADKKFIHISSESVYGSNDLSYPALNEDTPMNPLNFYSKTKADADNFISLLLPVMLRSKVFVLRSGWLFGPGSSHNFFWKIKKRMLEKGEAKVVDDQVGSLTSVFLVAEAVKELITRDDVDSGVYNIANEGFASRYEQAEALRKLCPELSSAKLARCKSSDFLREVEVPMNSCLDCSKLKKALGASLFRSWEEDLRRYVEEERRCQDQRQ